MNPTDGPGGGVSDIAKVERLRGQKESERMRKGAGPLCNRDRPESYQSEALYRTPTISARPYGAKRSANDRPNLHLERDGG